MKKNSIINIITKFRNNVVIIKASIIHLGTYQFTRWLKRKFYFLFADEFVTKSSDFSKKNQVQHNLPCVVLEETVERVTRKRFDLFFMPQPAISKITPSSSPTS